MTCRVNGLRAHFKKITSRLNKKKGKLMDLFLKGKTALVTGAARGLGASICAQLANEGAFVIAVSRTTSDLKVLIDSLPNSKQHKFFALDLAESTGPAKLIHMLKESNESPDIIVNNLGGTLGFTNPFGPIDEFKHVMRINLEVAIELNTALMPSMRKKNWGRIVHISSIAAIENQGPPSYCAAKAALNAYVRSVARLVCSENIVMTTVMPGAVLTKGGYWESELVSSPKKVDAYIKERMAIGRLGRPEEISRLVSFLCSEHASFCVGSAFLMDGGQGRSFSPNAF